MRKLLLLLFAVISFLNVSGQNVDGNELRIYQKASIGEDGTTYPLDMNGNRIINVGDPINPKDALNLQYFNENALSGNIVYDSIMWSTNIANLQVEKGKLYLDSIFQALRYSPDGENSIFLGRMVLNPLVVNTSGATIENMRVVYIDGAFTEKLSIKLADKSTYEKSRVVGVTTQQIGVGEIGNVTRFGLVQGNTAGLYLGAALGDLVYLGENGNLTNEPATGGNYNVFIGIISKLGVTDGELYVNPSTSEYTAESNHIRGWSQEVKDNVTVFCEANASREVSLIGNGYTYQDGVKYEWSDLTANYLSGYNNVLAYLDKDVITFAYNPTISQKRDILKKYAGIVDIIIADTGVKIYINDQRHLYTMPSETWAYAWDIHKCELIDDGINLTDIVVNGSGNLNAHAQFGNSSGLLRNQDIVTNVPSQASTVGYDVFFRRGTGNYNKMSGQPFPILSATAGRAYFNDLSSTGGLVQAGNGAFLPYVVVASNTTGNKVGTIMPTAQYPSALAAEQGALASIDELLRYLPAKEVKAVGIVIYETRTNYANGVKSRIVQTSDGSDYIDLRFSTFNTGGSSGGSTTFIDLTDTPNSYAGFGGKVVSVSTAEDGLEFSEAVRTINGQSPASGNYNITLSQSKVGENVTIGTGGTGSNVTFSVSDNDSSTTNEVQSLSNSKLNNTITITPSLGGGATTITEIARTDFLNPQLNTSLLNINGTKTIDGNRNVFANSFVKDGGTSGQFLKADGSIDNVNYTSYGGQISESLIEVQYQKFKTDNELIELFGVTSNNTITVDQSSVVYDSYGTYPVVFTFGTGTKGVTCHLKIVPLYEFNAASLRSNTKVLNNPANFVTLYNLALNFSNYSVALNGADAPLITGNRHEWIGKQLSNIDKVEINFSNMATLSDGKTLSGRVTFIDSELYPYNPLHQKWGFDIQGSSLVFIQSGFTNFEPKFEFTNQDGDVVYLNIATRVDNVNYAKHVGAEEDAEFFVDGETLLLGDTYNKKDIGLPVFIASRFEGDGDTPGADNIALGIVKQNVSSFNIIYGKDYTGSVNVDYSEGSYLELPFTMRAQEVLGDVKQNLQEVTEEGNTTNVIIEAFGGITTDVNDDNAEIIGRNNITNTLNKGYISILGSSNINNLPFVYESSIVGSGNGNDLVSPSEKLYILGSNVSFPNIGLSGVNRAIYVGNNIQSGLVSGASNNEIVIGNDVEGRGSNTITLGGAGFQEVYTEGTYATTNVSPLSSTPLGANAPLGSVPTADGNGNTTWTIPSGGSTPNLQQVLTAGNTSDKIMTTAGYFVNTGANGFAGINDAGKVTGITGEFKGLVEFREKTVFQKDLDMRGFAGEGTGDFYTKGNIYMGGSAGEGRGGIFTNAPSPISSTPNGANAPNGAVITANGTGGTSWIVPSGGGATPTLQQVTDVGATTTNGISANSYQVGASTAIDNNSNFFGNNGRFVGNASIGTSSASGSLLVQTKSGQSANINIPNGSFEFTNALGGAEGLLPIIVSKSETSSGLGFITYTSDDNANGDIRFAPRALGGGDYTDLDKDMIIIARRFTDLINIKRNGNTLLSGDLTAKSFKTNAISPISSTPNGVNAPSGSLIVADGNGGTYWTSSHTAQSVFVSTSEPNIPIGLVRDISWTSQSTPNVGNLITWSSGAPSTLTANKSCRAMVHLAVQLRTLGSAQVIELSISKNGAVPKNYYANQVISDQLTTQLTNFSIPIELSAGDELVISLSNLSSGDIYLEESTKHSSAIISIIEI